jgi:hypothetical protein
MDFMATLYNRGCDNTKYVMFLCFSIYSEIEIVHNSYLYMNAQQDIPQKNDWYFTKFLA